MQNNNLATIRTQIGAAVEQERTRQGLTYYAVSTRAGVKPAALMAIEEGRGYNIDTLLRVCDVLNLKVDILPEKN